MSRRCPPLDRLDVARRRVSTYPATSR